MDSDGDDKSQFSSWNKRSQSYRRSAKADQDIDPSDSISNVSKDTIDSGDESEREEGEYEEPSKADPGKAYLDVLLHAINTLEIKDAEVSNPSRSQINSTRTASEKPKASLPFSEEHKKIFDAVWNKSGKIPMFKNVTRGRYKIIDSDYNKYLVAPSKLDNILAQEVWRFDQEVSAKSKFKINKPVHPDKETQKIDVPLKKLEKQNSICLAAGVTQSWLLQFANTQVMKLHDMLKSSSSEEQFQHINDEVDLKMLSNALMLSQDATLDILDLQVRQAHGIKSTRRHMWLNATRWDDDVRDVIKAFPIAGDGVMCGPELKPTLEAYKKAEETLEVTEKKTVKSAGGQFNRSGLKRGISGGGYGRGAKRRRGNFSFDFDTRSPGGHFKRGAQKSSFRGGRGARRGFSFSSEQKKPGNQ